ncbi:MAG: YIP1 family protein [Planctomycetota bacterium]|nr:YIP1 family protein [Planctomycetota bacterium]
MPSGRYGPAFEHHRQLGFFPALWQTIKDVLAEPTQTFAALHLNNGYSLPFLYATLIALVAGIANQIWGMLLQGALIALTGAAGNVPISGMDLFGVFGGGVLGFLCAIPQAPFSAASAMFINGGIAHLMLMIFKANRYPFEATARAMAYAGTPAILCLIPVIGLLAAPIWGVVTAIIALREVHETTTGIAVAAILLPAGMALCCCCCLFALVPFLAS